MSDRTMNYFDYNDYRAKNRANEKHRLETLAPPGDESIEVDEGPAVTVNEIREHIRNMHEPKRK